MMKIERCKKEWKHVIGIVRFAFNKIKEDEGDEPRNASW